MPGRSPATPAAAISWSSKAQTSVAQPTVEAECYAQADACKEITFIRMLLNSIKFNWLTKDATPLHGDNQGAISLAHNPAKGSCFRRITALPSYVYVTYRSSNGFNNALQFR